MNNDLPFDIVPFFEVYGAACFEAQNLERGIGLLIQLSDLEVDVNQAINKMTLGDLHNLVKTKQYFTPAETKMINLSIKERNFLVHNCWDEYIPSTLNQDVDDVRKDIQRKTNHIRKASKIINEFIDNHLRKHNTSLDELGDAGLEGSIKNGKKNKLLH